MKQLRALEALLVRVEGAVAVALVLVMLALAGYNVVYRNVLVPMQKHWAHSGPIPEAPVAPQPSEAKVAAKEAGKAEPSAAEGFAGDWGEGGDEEDDAKAEPKEPDAAEGFAGDWGEGGDEADEDDAKTEAKTEKAPADDETFNLAKIDAVANTDNGELLGGPPPPGSFAANMVAFIDSIKLAWIDVVLRQLVILVAFFGAMMATQRGKHINVDALSKLLGPARQRWLAVATNLLATGVCIVFAKAGSALVGISREHPHELVPWADEWIFQLMFPLGFGLLAFHFAVRVAEAATGAAPEHTGGAA
jgi:TRAP-type C4-dicarboxylate transport system permease small subunit